MNIKLAVIGCGKWGFNHIRTAYNLLGANLVAVCDTIPKSFLKVKSAGINTRFTTDISDVLSNKEINSVIISTSAESHYTLAKILLENGKNVLVEKPMTLISNETEELIELAEKNNLKLMVGHILLYHPAVIKIKEYLKKGILGKLQYIYSNRLNLGTVRSEENILWSFAPHDISVIQFLTEKYPVKISAYGADFLQNNIEDITLTVLDYPDNVHSHIFVSWLHPFKEQRLVVSGSEGMMVFEDTLKNEKLKYYQKGYKYVNGIMEKFDADYEVVEFENKQPLEEEQKHFFECVLENKTPLTDGKNALDVLKILEAAGEALKQ